MARIVPGVHRIPFAYVNAFVVEGRELTLVDAGVSKSGARVARALADVGGLEKLRHVLVTHHHIDHVGPLARIAGDDVTVWAHPLDARVIRGDARDPTPASRNAIERSGVWAIAHLGPKRATARVDRELADGEEIPVGLVAYHTPGHTAGHMSFLMPSQRLLFVGDAAANYLGRLGPPIGLYSENHEDVRKSIAKLAALDFDVACFGHGRVLKDSAAARFRRLAEKVAG
jgi:glyoxylase-like metal-dependent hydrolase (beta-lactamase superfamily II)